MKVLTLLSILAWASGTYSYVYCCVDIGENELKCPPSTSSQCVSLSPSTSLCPFPSCLNMGDALMKTVLYRSVASRHMRAARTLGSSRRLGMGGTHIPTSNVSKMGFFHVSRNNRYTKVDVSYRRGAEVAISNVSTGNDRFQVVTEIALYLR